MNLLLHLPPDTEAKILGRPSAVGKDAESLTREAYCPTTPRGGYVLSAFTPPAALGFASDTALCASPQKHAWVFLWSADGESAAVIKDGQPVACIVAAKKTGYSRELVKDGPWGNVWSDRVFGEAFAT